LLLLLFHALQELRHFVVAPAGATWAEMVIRAGSYDTPKVYMVRCGAASRSKPT
jgi:hypothetical protein